MSFDDIRQPSQSSTGAARSGTYLRRAFDPRSQVDTSCSRSLRRAAALADDAAAFARRCTAPHADLLAGAERGLEARLTDEAHRADRLRGVAGVLVVLRIEELGVLALAPAQLSPARCRSRSHSAHPPVV